MAKDRMMYEPVKKLYRAYIRMRIKMLDAELFILGSIRRKIGALLKWADNKSNLIDGGKGK